MITVFVGQRGVGKSALLKRLKVYTYERGIQAQLVDLDVEIAKQEGDTISAIFSIRGEVAFRRLEQHYFAKCLEKADKNLNGILNESLERKKDGEDKEGNKLKSNLFIVVGAGFDCSCIPSSVPVVWVQRISDSSGRVFLDRPRLNPSLSPLQEYQLRSQQREPHFQKVSWEDYVIPEGLRESSSIESEILLGCPKDVGGWLTLLPENFNSEDRWSYFIQRRLRWGIRYFEIRDDWLTPEEQSQALRDIPAEKLLWSRRRQTPSPIFLNSKLPFRIDYDRELFEQQGKTVDSSRASNLIISVHDLRKGESLLDLFENLKVYELNGYTLKVSIEISTFEELHQGHCWHLENPNQRNFLPRANSGRWLWYRLWMGPMQEISFFKEGRGSAADQPTLYQWLERRTLRCDHFVALLGSPVTHSFTPYHQGSFFRSWGLSVLPIQIEESEFSEALVILKNLGLWAAAVTSPLKKRAFRECHHRSKEAETFGAVNTLVRERNGGWSGHNTDLVGLQALLRCAHDLLTLDHEDQICVWGGGGTLDLLKQLLPNAHYYSAQTGQPREFSTENPRWRPQWLIWAGGTLKDSGSTSDSGNTSRNPLPEFWQPQLIVDLNYREDSGGRELALFLGAKYLSGETMFYAQAKGQQLYWRLFLEDAFKAYVLNNNTSSK